MAQDLSRVLIATIADGKVIAKLNADGAEAAMRSR